MVTCIEIAGRKIGPGEPCFIIAEAGVNHNGDVDLARRMIDVAVEAGADAVKFQTFNAEKEIAIHAPKAGYQLDTTDASESQLDMARRLELPFESFARLYDHCQQQGIMFLSTPSDEESVDFLKSLGVSAFKVGSGEITNLPLLRYVANQERPLILSTGMSTLEEVETSLATVKETGNMELVLLHCVSNYPAAPVDANLKAMDTLRSAFEVPVGFSDHTLGIEISCAASALGASVIEKHFTLDNSMKGPDHRSSLEPHELRTLVLALRNVESALGDGVKRPKASELNVMEVARRSIVAARTLPAGTKLEESDLLMKRPGTGLGSELIPRLIGRITVRPLDKDELVEWSTLSNG